MPHAGARVSGLLFVGTAVALIGIRRQSSNKLSIVMVFGQLSEDGHPKLKQEGAGQEQEGRQRRFLPKRTCGAVDKAESEPKKKKSAGSAKAL